MNRKTRPGDELESGEDIENNWWWRPKCVSRAVFDTNWLGVCLLKQSFAGPYAYQVETSVANQIKATTLMEGYQIEKTPHC